MAIDDRTLTRTAGGWAFAEAIAWFILPDFFLLPAVVARPRAARRLVVAAFVGSTLGTLALAGLVILSPQATRTMLEALPFTHPAMFAEVAGRIDDVFGVAQQPISGIPAKVWTWTQIQTGTLPFVVFVAVLWAARTLRFVVVALVGELIAFAAGDLLRRWWFLALPAYAVAFLAALVAVTGF